jgi:hypothetical protein
VWISLVISPSLYTLAAMAERDDNEPFEESDESSEAEFWPNYAPVPVQFHSFLEEGPFAKCTLCDETLLEDGTQYLIHKAFHREEVIFEYAMCLPCRAKMQGELSVESIEAINAYMKQYEIEDRTGPMMEAHGTDVSKWLSHCLVTGAPIAEAEEYHYYAFCDGPDLVFNGLPIALAGNADEELNELLSQKTRDRLDGFVDEQFGLPPELRKPIKGSPVFI